MVDRAPDQVYGEPPRIDGIPDQKNRGNYRKKIIWTGLAILLLAVLTMLYLVFIKQDNTSQKVIYSGPPEKIIVANVGEHPIFNLIAEQQGYFKANGVDAQIKQYQSGPPAVADLFAGKIDVAVAADFAGAVNIFTHPELRIIAQVSTEKIFQVVARKDKGINEPADLTGKTIGVTKKSAGEFFLGHFLTFNNLNQSSVHVVDLPPAEIISRLEQGTIDAAVSFDPNTYNLNKTLGANSIIWPAQGEQVVYALDFSTKTIINNHPGLINRYLAALAQAEDYYRQHPKQTKDFIAASQHYSKEYSDYVWPKFDVRLGLDQELLLTMEDQAQWAIGQKLTTATSVPNYLNNIYFDGLEKVKPGSVSIIH